MGSMHTGLEESKNGYEKMAAFFAERARGGVGLIVTGGIAPNRAGWTGPFANKLTSSSEARQHKIVTDAVHEAGGKICMQILHSGRYGYHPLAVAPSGIKSPISDRKYSDISSLGDSSTLFFSSNFKHISLAFAEKQMFVDIKTNNIKVKGADIFLHINEWRSRVCGMNFPLIKKNDPSGCINMR